MRKKEKTKIVAYYSLAVQYSILKLLRKKYKT